MKILMAAMGLGIGGAETHIVELSKELRREGHDVAVCSNGGEYVEELRRAGIRHYEAPMHRRNAVPMLESLIRLRRVIIDERPDVVHAHARIPGFLCGILQRELHFPFVTTAHGVFDTGGALRALTNWGDRTIAVSEDIVSYLTTSYGLDRGEITLTINGIDTDKFSPALSGSGPRRELGIAEDARVVVHVSRLDAACTEAARTLIASAGEIAKAVPGTVIVIVGGGEVYDGLASMAAAANERLGYRAVVMTGPRTDVNALLNTGDVFVGVSRAALEAMASGLPAIIAGDQGYMGLFTEDKRAAAEECNFCGRGFGGITADTLAGEVIACLRLSEDERRRLGEYGRSVVLERHSVKRMAEDALTAYRAAIPAKRVVMSGYYGFGNAGDEAILASVLGILREAMPEAEVTVLSKSPEATERSYGCKAVQRFDPAAVRRTLKKCDVLVSGGGSLLQDSTSSRSLWYYLAILRMAQRGRKRVILLANGIGPVTRPGNRRRVRRAVERADAVTLRDSESLTELRGMGVAREDIRVTADPVFLLPPADDETTERILRENGVAGDFIAVSIRPIKGADVTADFAAICDEMNRRYGYLTAFIVMQPVRDDQISRETAAKMKTPSVVLSGELSPGELMGVIAKSRLILSMRLHSLIFAARADTPAVGFCYDPKVESCLKLLGLPSAGGVAPVDRERAVAAAAELLADREGAVRRLDERRREVTEAAKENLDIIKEICNG